VMKGLILVTFFWTDIVNTLPVEDKNMYETFLSLNSKLKSCSNYNVSMLESDIFKGLCSLPSPNIQDYSQSQDKIIQAMKFNLAPLLCYTIFHNVYAVCHPDTKISVKSDPHPSQTSDKFCEAISPISLPETCTHWIDDPDSTSKDDCFLVNEVVGAVLNNKDFCENKCLVPDLNKDVAPSVNPLCERLLDSSKVLAQMSPKGSDADTKQENNSASSNVDLSVPPGLMKPKEATEKAVVQENVDEEENKMDVQTKSGEEVIDGTLDVKGNHTTLKSDVKASAPLDIEPDPKGRVAGLTTTKMKDSNDSSSNNKNESTLETKVGGLTPAKTHDSSSNKTKVVVDPTVRADHPVIASNSSKVSNTNATSKPHAKINVKTNTSATPVEDVKISNKSSMAASDIDNESSGSFTSAFEFDYSSDSAPLTANQEKEEVAIENEDKEDVSNPKAEKEIDPKGIDAKPLVSEEEKSDDASVVEEKDDAAEKPSNDFTESKVEPALPSAEKEIVETKYTNNMKPGPEIDEQSSFFGYFILLSIVAIIAYLVFHNKQKILALVLEGRRRQGNRRRSGGREYRKLDSNLEDTMDPGKETSLRQVIY